MSCTRRAALATLAAAPLAAQAPRELARASGLAGTRSLTLHLKLARPAALELAADTGPALATFTPREGGLEAAFRTDANPAPLKLFAPRAAFTPAGAHHLVLRYSGHRLELFADGVLVDEEWPHGTLQASGDAVLRTSTNDVLEARLWPQSLPDAELFRLSGTPRPAEQILGPQLPVRQFWRPRGHNAYAGDVMPFFHAGRFHVFYLFDRRHHRSKWGLGAHQWAHLSTTDLRHWEHHPLALAITDEWEGSLCTGSPFVDGDTWYAFYATRMPDRSERLALATSPDGIHFTKLRPTPFDEPAAPYRRGPNRDPFVWKDANGLYKMLVTAELANPELAGRGGALELLTSPDLRHWSPQPPFYLPGYWNAQPECSELFHWKGWYYLLFSIDGVARYRLARSTAGPWTAPPQDILDCPQSRVMKTAAFSGHRRLGVSFVADGGYAGNLLFRELVQRPDGTLGTRTPPELEFPAPATALPGAQLAAGSGFLARELARTPASFRLRCRLAPSRAPLAYGLVLRAGERAAEGLELRAEPASRRLLWRPLKSGSLTARAEATITAVDGLDQPVELDIVTTRDLFDVCLNGHRTLLHRAAGFDARRLFAFVHGGALQISELTLGSV
jgi:hypothetical protein